METANAFAPVTHAGVTVPQGRDAQRAFATERLTQWIAERRSRAQGVVNRVMSEVPSDALVRAQALKFTNAGSGIEIAVPGIKGATPTFLASLHRNALGQLAERAGIPMSYVNDLDSADAPTWKRDLLAHAFGEHFGHNPARLLVRSIGSEVRGVMTDRYRRIDCRPVLERILSDAHAAGALVIDGTASDVRASVKLIIPEVLEPFPGEFLVAGMSWTDSNFGRGANEVEVFVGRLWCWNGAIADTGVRQIHIGRRLEESIEYSEKTLRLDTETAVSAIGDVTRNFLSREKINGYLQAIRAANAAPLDGKAAAATLAKRTTKATAEEVVKAFAGADVVQLPPGQTEWRWGQAIALVARDTADGDKRIDLERMAGEVLARHGIKAKA